MADVQIQQTPTSGSSGSGVSWAWALVVLALLAGIGWFVFGGGVHRSTSNGTTVEIKTPAPAAPAASTPPGGATKTP
jgi:MYXO-CTERM domain-containing protein